MVSAYPRHPSLHGGELIFTAEDDLWSVPADGGPARRLTYSRGSSTQPAISPDGTRVAFIGTDEGPSEVYVMDAAGGAPRRLTHQGGVVSSVAWSADGSAIRYGTNHGTMDARERELWEVPADGGAPTRTEWGRGGMLREAEDGTLLLYRGDPRRGPAYWKRYRGGTVGQIWIRRPGAESFHRMGSIEGNPESPCLVGDRLFFITDAEGHGNVYSCLLDGSDLKRHSDHEGHYARNLSTDGERLTYSAGGELYVLDPSEDQPRRVDVDVPVTETRKARRFTDPAEYFQHLALSHDGKRLAMVTRGKLFAFHPFDGPVVQWGERDGTAYRLPTWLGDTGRLLALGSDRHAEEYLVRFEADGTAEKLECATDLGRVIELVSFPKGDKAVALNNRTEVYLLDLSGETVHARLIADSDTRAMEDLAVSPDGKWVSYAKGLPSHDGEYGSVLNYTALYLYDVENGTEHQAAEHVLGESGPEFDPKGRFLHYFADREYEPTYDTLDFALHFPEGRRPYTAVLATDTAAPYVPSGEEPDAEGAESKEGKDKEDETADVHIDLDGLTRRSVPSPAGPGVYQKIVSGKDKLFVLKRSHGHRASGSGDGTLLSIDLTTGKKETFAEKVDTVWASADRSTLAYRSGDGFRVVKADAKLPEESEPGRESGWLDLSRLQLSVVPSAEWPQMFAEAWRLERDHFWQDATGGVDWDSVFDRYAPLAERVGSRGEFSDLVWELQGELGTSHAYEMFGDYNHQTEYPVGALAADFSFRDGGWHIERIVQGDTWNPAATSPLNRPGVNVEPGDKVLAVNGQALDADTPPESLLVNQAGREVQLTVQRGSGEPRSVAVRPMGDSQPAYYRDWVESRRRIVHEATGGRVGYIHIPDMGPRGFGEFYRSFQAEASRHGLVVDMRCNGGGHVSQLLWDRLQPVPQGSMAFRNGLPGQLHGLRRRGPLVGVIDERAGSDGDLGPHTFRERGMGTLVGTRTWGGVVGINPRFALADGTIVTQPEAACHVDGVGFGLENYGVDPDIEVPMTPDDFAAGRDPQLERAIEVVLKDIEEKGYYTPDLQEPKSVAPPALPPRDNGTR
ncbi:S41 family peptidase [Salininema proteolyticum]|uniref:Tricorn protease homolog n=1 Tax=Salininema proteolyticum TaxID=1607685 RepID=A0ABV8TW89_9ACTN